jgi:hypothetical protein
MVFNFDLEKDKETDLTANLSCLIMFMRLGRPETRDMIRTVLNNALDEMEREESEPELLKATEKQFKGLI